MSAKRLAVLVVPVLFLIATVQAQVNELSVTAGRTFVSTQTVPSTGLPIHFGNPASVNFDYARFLIRKKIFGFYAELPVGYVPTMDLNYRMAAVPKDIGALFITPSLRMNIFSGDSVTPWVSIGGGVGRLRQSADLNYTGFGPNPGETHNYTGVVQFGAGLDVWIWHKWGARFEARDYYAGAPDFPDADTGRSRQHNYYVGLGVARRF